MLNGLDLFSGIGGLAKALAPWVKPLAYCEIDRYCRGVLLSRMATDDLSLAPIWDDVNSLRAPMLPNGIDIITAGFPCQDISVAGNGAGLAGKRSGLFYEVSRLVGHLVPHYVFLENVPAIRTRGADIVTATLSAHGYDSRWLCLSAQELGAPHKRDRWFLLASDTKRVNLWDEQGRSGGESRERTPIPADDGTKEWRVIGSDFCRMDDGLPEDMDRLRALGNAVVPQQAREAFIRLSGIKP